MLLPNNRAESYAVNSVSLAFARIYDEKREESGLFEGSGTLLIPPPSYLCTMTMKALLDSQIFISSQKRDEITDHQSTCTCHASKF